MHNIPDNVYVYIHQTLHKTHIKTQKDSKRRVRGDIDIQCYSVIQKMFKVLTTVRYCRKVELGELRVTWGVTDNKYNTFIENNVCLSLAHCLSAFAAPNDS